MKFMKLISRFGKKPSDVPTISLREKHVTLHDTKDKAGWLSPDYSRSRAVVLDPNVLANNRCVAMFPSNPEVESYKVLRSRILDRIKKQGGQSVMITSAIPGEGKTTTAINLALTFAKEFEHTVLLVDGDLRRQRIHEVLGYESDRGLLNYLLDGTPVPELVVWPGIEKLTVISGGKTILESSEVIASPQMRELAADMKSRYPERYMFFDVPPVLAGADAMAFAPLVDWIILIVEAGKTPLPEVNRALQMLPREKVLGLILNRRISRVQVYPYQ